MVRRGRLIATAATVALLVAVPLPASADSVRDGQWYLDALGISRAHTLTGGAGVTVGIVDSGVDGSIPDLAGAVVAGKNFSGAGSADGGPVHDDPHGTRDASLLVGRGHGTGNTAGVLGSAPAAGLVQAAIDRTRGADPQLPAAVRWTADRGAKVINLSLGGVGSPAQTAAYRYAQSKDVVLVAAAGNSGVDTVDSPCNLPGVVCVGGIDEDLHHDSHANTGRGLTVVGPYATTDTHAGTPGPRDGLPVAEPASAATRYTGVFGTSSATPIVAGIIALIRAKYPSLDAANVINRLIRTAHAVGPSPNTTYGYGIPDAYRALTADVPTVRTNPLGTLAASSPATTPSPTATQPTTTRPAPTAQPDDSGPDAGLIAGIVVAVVIVGLGGTYAAIRRRRLRV